MKTSLLPLCAVTALVAACDPKPNQPSTPPMPDATPTMNMTTAPMPTPGTSVTPMPTASPTVPPEIVTSPDAPAGGAGPMTTPAEKDVSDKALIAPPSAMPGTGNTNPAPVNQ